MSHGYGEEAEHWVRLKPPWTVPGPSEQRQPSTTPTIKETPDALETLANRLHLAVDHAALSTLDRTISHELIELHVEGLTDLCRFLDRCHAAEQPR